MDFLKKLFKNKKGKDVEETAAPPGEIEQGDVDDDVEFNAESLKKLRMKRARKNIIFAVAGLVIIVAAGIIFGIIYTNSLYFSTDNVKVAAKFYTVISQGQGTLSKFTVEKGSTVVKNEIIGRVDNAGYLRSPIDGEVVQVNATIDQTVTPAAVLAVIADTTDIYISANVEETEIEAIKPGQAVKVKLDAFPGKTFSGSVDSIDKTTQTAIAGNTQSFSTSGTYTKVTQLFPVKIKITDDVDLSGLIGTNATVDIRIK